VDIEDDRRHGNGFVFEDYTAEDMLRALSRAVGLYRDDPGAWQKAQRRGMEQDLSWKGPARIYRELYRKLVR
jgi:starch synthase